MPVQPFELKLQNFAESMTDASKIQHALAEALIQIMLCPVNADGALKMKSIAQNAILHSVKIAVKAQERIKQN